MPSNEGESSRDARLAQPATGREPSRLSKEVAIGETARHLDAQPLRARARLDRGTRARLLFIGCGYLGLVALLLGIGVGNADLRTAADLSTAFVPVVILLAFLFETMDSAAGMGFGTALAPLLLALGYDPIAVVPVLLLTEAA